MNILLASSEVVPFAKTGGLADVCGTLPIELAKLGHRPVVMLPAYRCVGDSDVPIEWTDVRVEVPIGRKSVGGRLLRSTLPNSDVPVYLVENAEYFGRDGIYGSAGRDYADNCERYVFFCRAVMEAIRALELQVDVLHAHDWPTALLPAYLRLEYAGVPGYEQIAALFTIHNVAYQGSFWHWDMLLTGLDWKHFNWHQMEFHGHLNLMKTGLVFADAISTVSPTYAEEIQSAPLGCGMEGVLSHRRAVLSGIINGVDYDVWNPETDGYLVQNYNVDSHVKGKAACRAELQQQLGLAPKAGRPLVGFVGRLAGQKGVDLIIQAMKRWSSRDAVQWVILGTGDPRLERELLALAAEFPYQIAVRVDFSERLAHEIEAGADVFVMPSRYEPCGLNELYSLKYGAVPIVRETGGLSDTVTDTTAESLAAGTATGFKFAEATSDALSTALARAYELFHSDPGSWRQIVETGMRQDWSWAKSAGQYGELYEQLVIRHRSEVVAGGRF